jgi:hypothetical protein
MLCSGGEYTTDTLKVALALLYCSTCMIIVLFYVVALFCASLVIYATLRFVFKYFHAILQTFCLLLLLLLSPQALQAIYFSHSFSELILICLLALFDCRVI